ncbi:MAG: hypothetical protein A2508_09040 [Candidatus Lambdaproteobacteria bacterium RIFOXYD12_FULL_49_8]|uniref:Cupin fold metalloprotein WbuC cupin domain-containing protein n=1 Tax=Candidatus Lambdaproteobacteria bacterium RIFOXYD2_FULL_50_16 TaxID=1817772 RepID=A0A1F6GAN7_9PROT|nr:MAG: hypothetical protein A2527_08370 [Candidatus Lambdaproteobacteria bacterium RIFOXYD2_FULL_50_16]OGG97942.1 MAG: hypothetical protein A2508_09040 [Candidatus Lambdaproteobacteria bacterium RIFOXYD12_FULL_49_8]
MNVSKIDQKLIDQVAAKAKANPRLRMNHNFHQPQDLVQRMLNAIEPGSYVRPHCHANPRKDEIFLCLQGAGALVVFDERGSVSQFCPLKPNAGYFGVDVPAGTYHTILSLAESSVFYEVKLGPYLPTNHKDFADWAPEEGSQKAKVYLEELVLLAKEEMGWLER